MKKQLWFGICFIISLVPLIYLATIWKGLPDTVPTHFNVNGVPNNYSSKSTLWLLNGFMSALSFGLYLLLTNLHRIDPKRSGKEASGTFTRLAIGLVFFLSALNLVTILAANETIPVEKIMFPLVGLLYAFLGNIMYSIKPNYFAGIKLPWTLADDGNWRATHRLAGWIWFGSGISLTVSSFFLPAAYSSVLLFSLLPVMIGIPVCYSFMYFKRHQGNQTSGKISE